MRLHEARCIFGNLGGKAVLDPAGKLAARLAAELKFAGLGKGFSGRRGDEGHRLVVGILTPLPAGCSTPGINEHDTGHPAGCAPLLVMDVFEHAYMTDYGLKKADYIEAFFKNVDWAVGTRPARLTFALTPPAS